MSRIKKGYSYGLEYPFELWSMLLVLSGTSKHLGDNVHLNVTHPLEPHPKPH